MHDDHWSNLWFYVHLWRHLERVRKTETTPGTYTQSMADRERPTSEHLLFQWYSKGERRARFCVEMTNESLKLRITRGKWGVGWRAEPFCRKGSDFRADHPPVKLGIQDI